MLNKRIASVLVAGMVMVSMVGCNARLTIGEKEIFNFSDKDVQQENVIQNDKEVKDKENNKTNKAEEKKEETKSEEKYCKWCEKKTDHNSDDHIGICYDCGREMKAKDMEYNGRSFHCGCVDQVQCHNCSKSVHIDDTVEVDGYVFCNYCYNHGAATWTCENCGKAVPLGEMCECEVESTEELWVCPGCDGSYPESEMIEDTENGIWYCYGCYDEIMYDRMGGDANGDLEDWEF